MFSGTFFPPFSHLHWNEIPLQFLRHVSDGAQVKEKMRLSTFYAMEKNLEETLEPSFDGDPFKIFLFKNIACFIIFPVEMILLAFADCIVSCIDY